MTWKILGKPEDCRYRLYYSEQHPNCGYGIHPMKQSKNNTPKCTKKQCPLRFKEDTK